MVGEVGADPTVPEDNGFTVRRSCRFATLPYGKPPKIRTLTKWVGTTHATVTPRAYMSLFIQQTFQFLCKYLSRTRTKFHSIPLNNGLQANF